MNCTIAREPNDPFVTLTYKGEITRKDAFAYTLEAHRLAAQLGINRFLVDMTHARNVDTILNNYQFIHHDMRSEGINRFARVAALVAPNDKSHDFVILVSQNAFGDVRIFHDRALAVQFLSD